MRGTTKKGRSRDRPPLLAGSGIGIGMTILLDRRNRPESLIGENHQYTNADDLPPEGGSSVLCKARMVVRPPLPLVTDPQIGLREKLVTQPARRPAGSESRGRRHRWIGRESHVHRANFGADFP
jgi:hypothetical protein